MVGASLGAVEVGAVEGLGGGEGPVPVVLVGELDAAADVLSKLACGLERSSLGEIVVDATSAGNGETPEALELIVSAVRELVGVREVGLLDITAHHDLLAGKVSAGEGERICVSHDAVDDLRHDLLHGHVAISLNSDADVDVLVDLEVDLGLDGKLLLLVGFDGDLKFNLNHKMSLAIYIFLSHAAQEQDIFSAELKRYLRSC